MTSTLDTPNEHPWRFCLRCNASRRCHPAKTEHDRDTMQCDTCGSDGCIVAWRCNKCGRIVRGYAPDGPRVCGACPEPLATAAEIEEFIAPDGTPRIAGDCTLDKCRSCEWWVRRTPNNVLPRGKATCMNCAHEKTADCTYFGHKGKRSTPVRFMQTGVYTKRTAAGRVSVVEGIMCFACFDRSGAVHPTEIASKPTLALIEREPFVLKTSPRDKYDREAVIFDKEGVAALEERRVIRLNDGSILHHDWMGKDVFVIECEELRYERDTNAIVPRLSVTFNRGVHRAIMHRVAVKRAALEAHHRAHPRPMQPKPRVTPTDLGWILVSCDDMDAHGKPVFSIEYPEFDASEDTATWAGKVLR